MKAAIRQIVVAISGDFSMCACSIRCALSLWHSKWLLEMHDKHECEPMFITFSRRSRSVSAVGCSEKPSKNTDLVIAFWSVARNRTFYDHADPSQPKLPWHRVSTRATTIVIPVRSDRSSAAAKRPTKKERDKGWSAESR